VSLGKVELPLNFTENNTMTTTKTNMALAELAALVPTTKAPAVTPALCSLWLWSPLRRAVRPQGAQPPIDPVSNISQDIVRPRQSAVLVVG
jgi:hypothetical protein